MVFALSYILGFFLKILRLGLVKLLSCLCCDPPASASQSAGIMGLASFAHEYPIFYIDTASPVH